MGALHPTQTLDLRQFGYQAPPRWSRELPAEAFPPRALAFASDTVLPISLYVRNPHPGLSVRGKVSAGPDLFQTTLLDTKTWRVIRTLTWSNAGYPSELFPTASGDFVIWHNLEISTHAPDGTTLKTLALDPKQFPHGAEVRTSPSGATLFVINDFDPAGTRILCIATADLTEVGQVDIHGVFGGSDEYLAFLRAPLAGQPSGLYVAGIPRRGGSPVVRGPLLTTNCFEVQFLDERTLAVGEHCQDLTIVDVSGKVEYRQHFRTMVGSPWPCRACAWLVTGTYTFSLAHEFLPIPSKMHSETLDVIDRGTGRLAELPYKFTVRDGGPYSVALSPNGCLLARQLEARLDIYDLCDSPIAAQLGLKPRSQ